ncbi:group II truncated hemoglobin [Subtercola lobariae]|uniref:Oxidoreductase n=1 Tax=Subtercola lobariae TaxID=1588641 RepID=A0A917BCB4_9MICO|nr:group II truncated hemoglobin [Subtercola lobariae]GGF34746.1 oxidoreductase [Subtercola lobariae]
MVGSLFEAVGGAPAVLALARAWHERCLADPVVSHAFSHPGQHPEHIERLAAYWAEAWGGPTTYTSSMGSQHDVLVMHSANGVHEEMDQRAIACFIAALDDAHLPGDPSLRRTLTNYFVWSTTALAAHPTSAADVPASPPLPHWSLPGSSA